MHRGRRRPEHHPKSELSGWRNASGCIYYHRFTKERPPVFPISPRIRHIDIAIDFDRQYHHNLLVRGYYYFTLMYLYRKKLEYWLKTLKPDIVISTLGRELDFLTQLDDGSVKIGESHIAKPYTRNLHLMEQRGFPYKQIARHWRKKQEEAVKNWARWLFWHNMMRIIGKKWRRLVSYQTSYLSHPKKGVPAWKKNHQHRKIQRTEGVWPPDWSLDQSQSEASRLAYPHLRRRTG